MDEKSLSEAIALEDLNKYKPFFEYYMRQEISQILNKFEQFIKEIDVTMFKYFADNIPDIMPKMVISRSITSNGKYKFKEIPLSEWIIKNC